MTLTRKAERKICESCGTEFGCGAKLEGCWCAEVRLPSDGTLVPGNEFIDCLCPACLVNRAMEPAAAKIKNL